MQHKKARSRTKNRDVKKHRDEAGPSAVHLSRTPRAGETEPVVKGVTSENYPDGKLTQRFIVPK